MSENYTMVSVPKKTSNAGRPKGKKSYVMLFRWEDVKTCTRDEKGVKVTAFEMAEGKKTDSGVCYGFYNKHLSYQ